MHAAYFRHTRTLPFCFTFPSEVPGALGASDRCALAFTCVLTDRPPSLACSVTHSRHPVINVLKQGGGEGGALLTLATVSTQRRPQGVRLPLTSRCPADACLRERGGGGKEFSCPVTSLRALSAGVGVGGVGPTTPHEAPLRGAFVLCYSNSLVTVLNPRGSLTGGLGITGLTVNSSGVKGLGRCPKPCVSHAPLA